jgi:hypothetical protein
MGRKKMERPIGIEPTLEPWQGRPISPNALERRHLTNFERPLIGRQMENEIAQTRVSRIGDTFQKKARSRLARFALGDDPRTLHCRYIAANPSPDVPPCLSLAV